MRNADDIVERVRSAVSIVDVVGAHVRLRKRGRNYLGLCPFHSEKTPSFNVLDDKGIYKCFGCGEGGDVFSFLMKLEGLTFPETLERLAKQAGIEYSPTDRPLNKDQQDQTEALSNACRDYAAHCYRALRSDAGTVAYQYLRERRFNDETLKRFAVGYAPDGGASFLSSSQRSASSLQLFEQAGIISRGNSGEHYDRFHGRIIFPITSATGKIIGFGGRVLPTNTPATGSQFAKYVNSPETALYHKSQILYGLFQAKDAIRKKDFAILVEGYADVIALSQAGFENVVAASGTSLTTEQLNVLRRFTKQIVLLFDADTAGKNASLRGIELALVADFDITTVALPGNEDPDSFIRANGAEAFAEQLDRRTSFVESKTRLLKEAGEFDTPEKSARAIRSIVTTIAKVSDPIKREFYVRRIAEKFRLLESTILTELKKILSSDQAAERRISEREERLAPSHPTPPPEEGEMLSYSLPSAPPTPAEKLLVRSFIEDTETAYRASIEMDFDFTLLENEIVKSIIQVAISKFEEFGTPLNASELVSQFEDDPVAKNLIIDSAAAPIQISGEWVDAELSIDEIREEVRLATHQSCAIISRESLEKQLIQLRIQLNGDIDEDQLHSLLKESTLIGKKLEDIRGVQSRFHLEN